MAINWDESNGGAGVDLSAPAPATPGGQKIDYGAWDPNAPHPTYVYGPGASYDQGGNYIPDPIKNPKVIPATPAPAPAIDSNPKPQPADWSSVSNWDPSTVSQYFASVGVTPNGTSPQYWADQWNAWGKKDPAYFFKRLQSADEIVAAGKGSPYGGPAYNGGGATLPGTNVGAGPSSFSDADTKYLTDLLNARMGALQSPVNDAQQQQLLDLLSQQTGYYSAQRAAQEQANAQLKARMEQADASAQALVDYMNKRVGTLQQPAYTGAEAEVLRTRALDPIEADRQAALQRAMNQASQSGMALSSGINQALLNNTNAGFDKSRAQAQNDLAYNQIQEQRSREQEAQALLAQIPQIQRAGASGDLAFLQSLDQAINQPQLGAIATAGQGAAINQANREEQTGRQQELLGLAQLLQQLPTNAAQQAMAAAGLAGNPESLLNSMIQLYGIGQNNQSNWAQTLGQTLSYLSNSFKGGTGGTSLGQVGTVAGA